MSTRYTVRDVALRAGVGVGTVSRVLNHSPDVAVETRQRVLRAIQELNYRPNAAAKTLRTSRTHVIGFITDEIASTPFAVDVVKGAQDAAWKAEKLILLVNTNNELAIEEAAVEMMLERRVEGIIYATMFHRQVSPPEIIRHVPTVLLDCFIVDGSLPSVVPDERTAARTAVEILIQKGHRHIGFINQDVVIPAVLGRLQGYRDALAEYAIPYDPTLVLEDSGTRPDGGFQPTLALMKRPDPPTAIFCFNDRMAMSAYNALHFLGFSIPDDVAVMGFDNQEIIATKLNPPLSTMALPHYEMGQWAVSHLIEVAKSPHSGIPVQLKMQCPYVERASV